MLLKKLYCQLKFIFIYFFRTSFRLHAFMLFRLRVPYSTFQTMFPQNVCSDFKEQTINASMDISRKDLVRKKKHSGIHCPMSLFLCFSPICPASVKIQLVLSENSKIRLMKFETVSWWLRGFKLAAAQYAVSNRHCLLGGFKPAAGCHDVLDRD